MDQPHYTRMQHGTKGGPSVTTQRSVGVIGARSAVGLHLLPILRAQGWRVIAMSTDVSETPDATGVEWHVRGTPDSFMPPVDALIFIAPIWCMTEWTARMTRAGVKRVVAVSSTSLETKAQSANATEQGVVAALISGEAALAQWAEENDAGWTVLRPTLIWGGGMDRNVTEIARVARRLGFFPLPGGGKGLRQPIHAKDVAHACLGALESDASLGRSYDIPGGETLTYAEMARRICNAATGRARLPRVPVWMGRAAVQTATRIKAGAHWTPEMVSRINSDMVFDAAPAARDFGHDPCGFHPASADVSAPFPRGVV